MNLSISWFFVLAAFIIMVWLAWKSPPTPPYNRWTYISWALFFASILVQGFITMHASGSAHG